MPAASAAGTASVPPASQPASMALMTTTLKMTGESAGSQKTSRQCNTAMPRAAIPASKT